MAATKKKKKTSADRRETNKQKVFVQRYTTHWNGARAAREAGYSGKTARQMARENLTKPYIRAQIQSKLKEMAMDSDEVLARLAEIARGSVDTFVVVNDDGFAALDFSGDANESMHLIKKIKSKRTRRAGTDEKGKPFPWEDENVEIEIHDPQRALELLGKYHKLFNDKLEVEHTLNVENLKEVMDRVYGNADDQSG